MRSLLLAALVLVAAPARAHVGAVVSNANFTSPAAPPVTMTDGGVVLTTPTDFPTADQSFTVTWEDGDNDPTGHFTFYYLDHQPNFELINSDIETLGAKTSEVPGAGASSEVPVAIWAGCDCNDGQQDAGFVCPDAGVRDCRNSFNWDTSQIPNGTYWLVAVNNDPPFHVNSPSLMPVRISHTGETPPPAAVFLRPDGYGSFDTSYRVQWYAVGKAPLTFELDYGLDDHAGVLGPVTPLPAGGLISNPDGTTSYDWDLTDLVSLQVYFLRLTVTDADGKSTYTDSRYGLSIFHPQSDGGAGDPRDLGARRDGGVIVVPTPKGCSCELGGPATLATVVPLGLLLLLVVGLRLARRGRA